LQHPLVKRLLWRLRAQGHRLQDLSRVTIIGNHRRDSFARVFAFARLTLFGPGGSRLHDQLISLAADWHEAKGKEHVRPLPGKAERAALRELEIIIAEGPTLADIPPQGQRQLQEAAATDFAALWPLLQERGDGLASGAERRLHLRGEKEASALRQLILAQINRILKTLGAQPEFQQKFSAAPRAQRQQLAKERQYIRRRVKTLQEEYVTEPLLIEERYRVVRRHLEPVGLVYLWPSTSTKFR
jgi:hypothetical protein